MDDLEQQALGVIQAGIAAADPAACVARAMDQALSDPPDGGGRWHVIALGKAARAMAQAALARLPAGTGALVITNAGNAAPLPGARVLIAGHPVPDAAGEAAAQEVEAVLTGAARQDRVLALISGGGSAMLPAPVAGVSLADKQAASRLLLGSGADIGQMNLIRQALSRLKGGGWLRLGPAPVVALILSDVPGDDLRVIASGPTAQPVGSIAEAAQMARSLGIWDDLPAPVQRALSRPEDRGDPVTARNILIGSNGQSVQAMIAAAKASGWAVHPAPFGLEGDVADCAARMLAVLRDLPAGAAMAFGGETTVRLTGDGMGGRNQELALRFALMAEGLGGDWRLACVGSDGRDGPGEAAGGLVGPDTPARLRLAGLDPEDVLRRNDSTPALAAADALVTTGATGTNVADLAIFLRARG